MPVPTQEQYIKMLNTAKKEGYAYPAVNVTTIEQQIYLSNRRSDDLGAKFQR